MSKRIALLFTVFLVLLVFTSCKGKGSDINTPDTHEGNDEVEDELTRETIVYYADDAGYLVPVMRKIPWVEGIAKATIKVMMDTPEQQESLIIMGLRPLLPTDAKILGMSIVDGIAKVDFNNALLECKDALSESNMIQGLVMTLSGFSTIDKVQCRSVSQFDYLVPVTRVTSSMHPTLENTIEEWLKSPVDKDNMTLDLPYDTKLLSIQMKDGVTYINFSKEFNNIASDPKSEEMVLRALKLITSHYPEVEQLKILVENKEYKNADIIDDLPVFANEY